MAKTKQISITDGKPVSPVTVKKTPVRYVKEEYGTDKFDCRLRDDKRKAADDEGDLESYVRQQLRVKKGSKVAAGETDDAVQEILAKVEEEA